MKLDAQARRSTLIRIERKTPDDKIALIRSGAHLVAERQNCLLALVDLATDAAILDESGYRWLILESDTEGWDYYSARPRDGVPNEDLAGCADAVWTEEGWILLRTRGTISGSCRDFVGWTFSRLPLQPMAEPLPPPVEYALFQDAVAPSLAVKPLVQEIVNLTTPTMVQTNWSAIINAATTRYSTSAGCSTATQMVYDKFLNLGLNPIKQNHTSGHAPNVIGVITGKVTPQKVCIVIGHIDDMPSSGLAPGANDNASGACTVTSAAQAMAGYAFTNTVKFLVVTGEEFDLYGSWYYADDAYDRGELIQGVLDADMTGWEGDGLPSSGENLDVDYNSSSMWLGTLLTQCAADYGTGCPVNAFLCPIADYSDHYPFWANGYSAIMGITDNEGDCNQYGTYDYYHTSQDTLAHCGAPAFYYKTVKAYAATLAHMADPLCKPPAAPTGLSATPTGATSIALSWTPAVSGMNHEIHRALGICTTANPFTKVGESSTGSYTDSSAAAQTTYAYKVYAKDATGYCVSTTAPCASATTPANGAPTMAVYIFNGTRVNPGSYARFYLNDPNPAGSVTGYNMYRTTDRTAAKPTWPRIGTNLPDENGAAADVQLTDQTSSAPPAPGNVWFYVFTAYNASYSAEGPF